MRPARNAISLAQPIRDLIPNLLHDPSKVAANNSPRFGNGVDVHPIGWVQGHSGDFDDDAVLLGFGSRDVGNKLGFARCLDLDRFSSRHFYVFQV